MSLNAVPDIALLTKQQTATMVKNARVKGLLTQKELADKAGISLRSLQRIESADVLPRYYTLQQLAAHVDIALSLPAEAEMPMAMEPTKVNVARKWILTFSSLVVIILSFGAYVLQSPTFPDTQFEMCLLLLAGCIIYAAILYRVWK